MCKYKLKSVHFGRGMIWWMLIFLLYLRADVRCGVFLTLLVLKEKAWPEPSCMGERLPGKTTHVIESKC